MCIENGVPDNEIDPRIGIDEVRSSGLMLPYTMGASGSGGEGGQLDGCCVGWGSLG